VSKTFREVADADDRPTETVSQRIRRRQDQDFRQSRAKRGMILMELARPQEDRDSRPVAWKTH